MSDLLYTAEEEELRSAVRALLEAQPDPAVLWRRLAVDIGCAGLAVPEKLGGAGASFREVAVVVEELGRAVSPVPYLGASIATATLLACPGDAAHPLLTQVADGSRLAVLAVPFSTAPDGDAERTTSVADALTADLVLALRDGDLYAYAAAEVARTPLVSLDETRPLCDIAIPATGGSLLASGGDAYAAVRAGLTAGAALLASEQVGVAQWCLDTTVAYVNTRVQFARPVGSFQAVKHRLADVWVEVTQARAVARYAAGCLATQDADLPVAVAVAQSWCSPVAVHAAEECVQLHGGIGFTWEHPAHRYLKRAKSSAIALGTADRHRAALVGLADLPGPV